MNDYSITLFCSGIGAVTGAKSYKRVCFNNADWQQNLVIKFLKYNKSSMNTDSDILIFVPYHKSMKYVTPKKYNQLENKEGYYTFNVNDKIVKGIIDFEITSAKDLKELELKFDDVVNILKIEDCNMFKHFELACE